MNLKQWVQHISGEGEKWEVSEECSQTWCVYSKATKGKYTLPKSEYRECEPPEEWEDVSEKCEAGRYDYDHHDRLSGHMYMVDRSNLSVNAFFHERYRITKIQRDSLPLDGYAFIVERRKS